MQLNNRGLLCAIKCKKHWTWVRIVVWVITGSIKTIALVPNASRSRFWSNATTFLTKNKFRPIEHFKQ